MTQLSYLHFTPSAKPSGSSPRWVIAVALLGVGVVSCSEETPTPDTAATEITPGDPSGAPSSPGMPSGAGGTPTSPPAPNSTGAPAGTGGAPPSPAVPISAGAGGAPGGAGGAPSPAVPNSAGAGGTVPGSGGTGGMMIVTGGAGGMSSGAGGNGGGGTSSGGTSSGGTSGGGTSGGAGGTGGDDGTWTELFNGTDLDGWTPSQGHSDLFGVGEVDGGPVIHVYPTQPDQSDQPQATLRTNEPYSSYVFHLEYKWGVNRFGARAQSDRDNGLCFHICGDETRVWPESIELQIGSQAWPGDWVTGNIFMLVDKTRAQWPYTMMDGQEVFSEGAAMKSIGAPASYYKALVPSPNLDIDDDWNVIELTVRGAAEAEYKVNGTVVNRVFDMECDEGGGFQPLDQGPIALQAEFAEVYFRNIRIQVTE